MPTDDPNVPRSGDNRLCDIGNVIGGVVIAVEIDLANQRVDDRRLKAGDPIRLVAIDDAWIIQDARGRTLGRMARAWAPPQGRAFFRGEVGAIVRWRKIDNKEEYRTQLRRDQWEVVLPELVFG